MVKRSVPSKRLLVFSEDEGWEPLCKFLGKPVPDVPFPRGNGDDDPDLPASMQRYQVMRWAVPLWVAAVASLACSVAYAMASDADKKRGARARKAMDAARRRLAHFYKRGNLPALPAAWRWDSSTTTTTAPPNSDSAAVSGYPSPSRKPPASPKGTSKKTK